MSKNFNKVMKSLIRDIQADIDRYVKLGNHLTLLSKMKMYILNEPLWYLLVYRLGTYLNKDFKIPLLRQAFYLIFYVVHKFLSVVTGIQIPLSTDIGKGVYLPHFGTIVVHQKSIIGEHCNIGQGVTIGVAGRGARRGTPIIGNYVYIEPGAKIIDNIRIGNNVMIGANAVVTKDVPDHTVVGGVPAKIISFNGWETEGNPFNEIKK